MAKLFQSLPLALVFGLTGCVQTQMTRLDTSPRPAVTSDQVRVYRTADAVGCDYTEVALIQTQGEADATSDAQMIRSARKRAAKAGANGLLIESVTEPDTAERVADAVFGTGAKRRGDLLAIYVDSACQAGTL